jgi:hypothetical protein
MTEEQIINSLGFRFDDPCEVKGKISIAHLFTENKDRCGIYLLKFSDNTFYIGQAKDVVKRFRQHCMSYDNIVHLWFQPVEKEKLNETEERFIRNAESDGLLLKNIVHVSSIVGESNLDKIISPAEQQEWLDTDKEISNDGYDLYPKVEEKYKIRYRQRFENLKANKDYALIKRILSTYIHKCLPAFKKTESDFWSLSCLPATNQNSFPRYFCMNVNFMEVFVAGYDLETKEPFAFFVLSTHFMHTAKDINRILTKYPDMDIAENNYKAAGVDQVSVYFSDLAQVEDILLTEPVVVKSIKELNLRLMRKGPTIFSKYHCFDLVHDVLS